MAQTTCAADRGKVWAGNAAHRPVADQLSSAEVNEKSPLVFIPG